MMQHFFRSPNYETGMITILQDFGSQNIDGNIQDPDYQPRQQDSVDLVLESIFWTRSIAESVVGQKNQVRGPHVFACDPNDITVQVADTDRVKTEDGQEYDIVSTEDVAGQGKIYLIWAEKR